MPDYIQANTAGRLHAATEPSLSPLNRGYLYGDAIYEVWRTYHGVLFAWEEHWRRLERSAAALSLSLPWTPGQMLEEIRRTVTAYRAATSGSSGELYIRLQITRGMGAIGLDMALADRPDFVLLVQPNPQWSAAKATGGVILSCATALRRNPADSLNPAWKTGNYLNNILCLQEARARGADEVLITNHRGEITEAAVSNVAFIRDNALFTPPLTAGILGGITRELVCSKIAPMAGMRVVEQAVRPEVIGEYSECFLMSTTKDVSPVAAVDAVRFHIAADSAVQRLKAAFGQYAQAYATAHPELRVT